MENAFEPNGWEDWGEIPPGWCTKGHRLVRTPAAGLTASVYVVEPGEKQVPYHFHHGAEEILLVLEGTPTLRTPAGERALSPGDVVHFPRGPEGAHQVRNDSGEPVRVVVVDAPGWLEIVEYPDSGKVGSVARTPFHALHFKDQTADYWDGEVDLRDGA
ncbi:MAG: cupin domain-containing protein [Actinomycetota bacterium]